MFEIFKEFYKGKKVLITGQTGFKGAWLSLLLHYLGAELIGIALEPRNNEDLYNLLKLETKIKSNFCDIRNREKLREIILREKPEIIFHLAAQSLVLESYEDPYVTFETNVLGTMNLLEALKDSDMDTILLNITSDKCYENNNVGRDFQEGDALGGLDPYSASKAMVEILSKSYSHSFFSKSKIKACTVRAGNVIGGGDWANNRLIPDIARSIKAQQEILIRNPNSTRPWQHVLEPLWAYALLAFQYSENYDNLLKQDQQSFEHAWNIGPNSENVVPVKTLLDIFISNFNDAPDIIYGEESIKNHYEAKTLSLNSSKIKSYFGWEPRLSLAESINMTASWYRAYINNQDIEDFSIKQLEKFIELGVNSVHS